MRIFYTTVFCWVSIFCFGQKLGPYTISSTGQSFETEEVSLYVSIGEPINTMISEEEITVSQGILQVIFTEVEAANPPCAATIDGTLFFENCDDGQLYFFIKTDDGKIYDPYYVDGVSFATEGEADVEVKFGFIEATFETPCSIAEKAILITCIEQRVVSSIEKSEVLENQLFEILPNPSQNTIKLFLQDYNRQNLTLQIFDLQGKELLNQANIKHDDLVDISSLANGIYHLSLSDKQQRRKTIKLVKH